MGTYPAKGWRYIDMIDHDDVCEVCEYCGTEIRYEHLIEHDEIGVIGVGCICCDYLTREYIASDREAKHKRDLSRIRTLLKSSRWQHRKNGHFITYRDYKIIVWDNGDAGFCLQVQKTNEWTGYWYYVHRSYHDTFEDAVKAGYFFIKKN